MRKLNPSLAGAMMTGLAAAVVGLCALSPLSLAEDGRLRSSGGRVSGPPLFNPDHQSVLRIKERDGVTQHRGIKLARNKSMLLELPRDLRDVIVSNPEIMDAVVQQSNRVYLIGKKFGQSNAFFFDAKGQQILTLEVVVEHDTAPLDSLFARLIPGSSIKAEILNDTVILTGGVRNPSDSARASDIASRFIVQPNPESDTRARQKVINLLQVDAEEQVMLRVMVAEVERSVLKQFGINLGAAINAGNFSTSLLTENALPLTAAAGLGGLPVPIIGTTPSGSCALGALCNFTKSTTEGFTNSGASGGAGTPGNRVSHAIRMLERHGLVRTLAEPNLTAISGETAKFLAGGEYPIPTVDSTGKVSVTYKEFGVGVSFTPIVLSEGRINLKIRTEVSELSNAGAVTLSGISISALKKRQAESTVELPSGGTLALAGLLSEDTRKNIDGMPGLKDLPILGTLFRSQDYIKRETELVVLVTPYTVKPQARQNLASPTDGLAAASDLKSNLLGHMNRVYAKGGVMPIAAGSIKDESIGFIVD